MTKNRKMWLAAGLFAMLAGCFAATSRGSDGESKSSLTSKQIAAFRERGQAGLDEALAAYDDLSQQIDAEAQRVNTAPLSEHGQLEALRANRDALRTAIGDIGGQRSCEVSRLFWYTDLEKAKAEAARTGRPILSLRMLGKLTDEFSCANSRFFRTSLYSNTEISEVLRKNFVLHWQSVRPVPRVTIDFGDGRKLERTLTGNSAHHVLTATGQPLDVLPGLYSPSRFNAWLNQMKWLNDRWLSATPDDRPKFVEDYHNRQRAQALMDWDRDIQQLGAEQVSKMSTRIDAAIAVARIADQDMPDPKAAPPDAALAAARVITKSSIERPMLRFANLGGEWMERGMDDDLWKAVSNLHRDEVQLDQASVTLMRREFPQAALAGARSVGKRRVEDPMLRLVRAFEDSIALDTVRNEYLLHRQVHEKFRVGDPVTTDVDKLTEWVYAELFLTPSTDPWLGLAPNDVYTALENGGQIVSTTPRSTTSQTQ